MARISKKEIIMDTAKKLFSQKGYDATGMEEIAVQANVTKSLIYYHFKSKEELLDAVIAKFFSEFEQLIEVTAGEPLGKESYFNFLYSNKEFLRIIIVESLKTDRDSMPIFEVVRKIMGYESTVTGKKELLDYSSSHSRWIAEFFTSILPFATFTCYVDDWCKYFETDIETAKHDFISAFRQTHGAYHAKLEGENECGERR